MGPLTQDKTHIQKKSDMYLKSNAMSRRYKNTNNSAARVSASKCDTALHTDRALIATPRRANLCKGATTTAHHHGQQQGMLYASNVQISNNSDVLFRSTLDTILNAFFRDKVFRGKYNYQSVFLIGAGVYGQVFRVISNAIGPVEKPLYNADYLKYIQIMKGTQSKTKSDLLDAYRDSLCLDLVAIKVEVVTPDDVFYFSDSKIQLIKEFKMLTWLFSGPSSFNCLVGFPLPIDFGFLGSRLLAKDLRKVPIFDEHGTQSNYYDAFIGGNDILQLLPSHVTSMSYLTMELLGPNLDEFKEFFAPTHSKNGRMFFSVQTTLKLMDQFLCRLLVMHRKNMVHLDLKPDNLCMGIGKMSNTVYLIDYGLSRICSDEKPKITMGSRRYMSVGVMNLQPANYIMDIESWFYVLLVLLIDFVPWSDEVIMKGLSNDQQEDTELLMLIVARLKKEFWGDDGSYNKKLLETVMARVREFHRSAVPDIEDILMDIYQHVGRMRKDFYRVSSHRMSIDINNDESDLFKRYQILRKLLLFPYDCNFQAKGSCFATDKDLIKKQQKRRNNDYPMLTLVNNRRNWHWDWDDWYEAAFVNSNNATEGPDEEGDEEEEEEDRQEPTSALPEWMRHYLARVLELGQDSNSEPASSS